MKQLGNFSEWGGTKRHVVLPVVSDAALLSSILGGDHLSIDPAWISIIFCGVPIILEAVVGLVTAFDIKADVLVSLALIASVLIGEDFAAGAAAPYSVIDGQRCRFPRYERLRVRRWVPDMAEPDAGRHG